MADVVRAARDAGATGVWTNVLYLRPGTREHFLDHLARDWPELLPTYERLYARSAYVSKDVLGPVRARVAGLAEQHGIADRRAVRLEPDPDGRGSVAAVPIGLQVAAPGQLALPGWEPPNAS
jgi:hypothetical protein